MGFQNQPTHQPSPGPLLLPWRWWFLQGPPPPRGKIPVRVPVASGHTCCKQPDVRNVLSPQIRAAEGLTSAVKGEKVVYKYKTGTGARLLLSPSFLLLECGEARATNRSENHLSSAGPGLEDGQKAYRCRLMADSGLGGPAAFPARRVLPLMKYLPCFPNMYFNLPKGYKVVCLCRKDKQRVILNVWRRLAVGSEGHSEDLAALGSFCRRQLGLPWWGRLKSHVCDGVVSRPCSGAA